jgi:hypothetical protein
MIGCNHHALRSNKTIAVAGKNIDLSAAAETDFRKPFSSLKPPMAGDAKIDQLGFTNVRRLDPQTLSLITRLLAQSFGKLVKLHCESALKKMNCA